MTPFGAVCLNHFVGQLRNSFRLFYILAYRKMKKPLLFALRVLLLPVFLLTILFTPSVVLAAPKFTEDPLKVSDGFKSYDYAPDENGFWWTKIDHHVADGSYAQTLNTQCVTEGKSCLLNMNNGNKSFMRFIHEPLPAGYELAKDKWRNIVLADVNPNFSAPYLDRWVPEVGHPIVVKARVRFSPNYTQSGDDAVGSAGIWLWNMPFFYGDENFPPNFYPLNAIGLTWADQNSLDGELTGLTVTVNKTDVPFLNAPVYIQKVNNVTDLTDWMDFKMRWSRGEDGSDKVKFWVNEEFVGEYTMDGMLPPLAFELWVDNQVGEVNYSTFSEITNTQYMDVDYLKAKKGE